MLQRMERSLNVSLTDSHREWLVVSHLDKNGVDAYKSCLDAQNKDFQPWTIYFSDFAAESKLLLLEISFNPNITANNVDVYLDITNGKLRSGRGFTKAEDGTYKGNISSHESIPFSIDRDDMGEVFQLSINGGGK